MEAPCDIKLEKLHLEIFRFFRINHQLEDRPVLDRRLPLKLNFYDFGPKMCTKITVCDVHNLYFLDWTNEKTGVFIFWNVYKNSSKKFQNFKHEYFYVFEQKP